MPFKAGDYVEYDCGAPVVDAFRTPSTDRTVTPIADAVIPFSPAKLGAGKAACKENGADRLDRPGIALGLTAVGAATGRRAPQSAISPHLSEKRPVSDE
jgi:hypothetical protein